MKKITLPFTNKAYAVSIFVAIAVLVVGGLGVIHEQHKKAVSFTNSADKPIAATTAERQTFTVLSTAHTDVCQDMGDMPAMEKYMNSLPSGSRLQGSCCSPMDMKKYVSQVNGLKAYANISQVPKDPYDVSVDSAKQMLGFYDIQLTSVQQTVFDKAQSMTDDHGWCCCKCWAWYTHAGLAKYLIAQRAYTAKQIVEVTNLEDCCGGAS